MYKHETLYNLDDQVSTPTWARTLAEATALVIAQGRGDVLRYLQEKSGLYHLTDGGKCSRYEWAKAILALDPRKHEQAVREVLPTKSAEFPGPAQRPMRSIMACKQVKQNFNLNVLEWDKVLILAMEDLLLT